MELILRRNSEIQVFKECRQRWYWAYRSMLRSREPRPALETGSLVHAALERYYKKGRKRGPHPAKIATQLYEDYLRQGGQEIKVRIGRKEDDDLNYVPMIDLVVEMLTNYVQHYGKDDWIEVLAPEQQYQVDVYHPKSQRYLFTAVGTIDLCFRDLRTNRIGFLEHKTGTGLEPFGAPESLDEQSGTYWVFGPQWLRHIGAIGEHEELDFIMFNRLKKAFGDKRPKDSEGRALNKDGTISKRQPAPLFKRTMVFRSDHDRAILDRRIREVDREIKMVDSGKLKVYKSPGRQCTFCEFRSMCEVHESGGDYKSMMKELYVKSDPYEEHTEDQDED